MTDLGTSDAMRFAVDPGQCPQRARGTTSGALLGGIGMSAVCCVELDGGVIWPADNPVRLRVTH